MSGMTPLDRFLARLDRSGDCWLWTGYVEKKGYGALFTGGKRVRAHVFAYRNLVGPIPDGLQVDHRHTCPKRCVKPEHLRLGTPSQNNENHLGPRKDNTSGVRGVSLSHGKWRARVRHNRREYSGGVYDNLADAEAAVIALRLSLHEFNDKDRS